MTRDFKIEIDPAFLEQMEHAPPEVKVAALEMVANLRNAAQAFNEGRYDSIQDAMAALGCPMVDCDDDE